MDKKEVRILYEKKSDEALLSVVDNANDYTEETVVVVKEIIDSRGGLDALAASLALVNEKKEEINTIRLAVINSLNKGDALNELKSRIEPKYLNANELEDLLKSAERSYVLYAENQKTTTKSLIKGIVGGVLGSIVGGVFWGLMLIWSGRIFFLLIFGLLVCSYFFVWLFSRKDKENKATAMITVFSAILAFIFGQLIFEVYGPMEYLN